MQPQEQASHEDAKDLLRGAFLNLLGMFAKVSKFLFMIVAARIYGPKALGLYLLAWNTIDIASKFGLWGADRSLLRDIARYYQDDSEETKDRIFGILRFNLSAAFCLSILVSVAMFFLSPLIAEKIFNDTNLITPLEILSFAIPFVVMTHAFIATTKALRLLQYEVLIRQTIEPLCLLILTLLLIPLQWGAKGLAIAQLIASFIAVCGAAYVTFKKYRNLGWRHAALPIEMKKETLRYTSPVAVMDFLNLMVARIDILLVGSLINTVAAGFYGIAVEVISIIKKVRHGFEPIFSPIVSELFYSKQKERLQRNYVLVTRWLIAGSLLPMVAMVLFPNQILALFNEQATQAAGALVVLALSHGLFVSLSAAESLLIMTGRTFLNTGLGAIMLVINTIITILLIPEFGMVGAAIGMLAAHAFVSFARIFLVYQQYNLHPFGYPLLWPMLTAGVTTTVFLFISSLLQIDSLAKTIFVLVMILFFYAAFYFLGAREPEERHLLYKIKDKVRRKPAVLKT